MTDADGFVFAEASKLLCYCRYVLLDQCPDIDSVKRIRSSLNERVLEMEITLESIKHADGSSVLIEKTRDDSDAIASNAPTSSEIDPKKQMKVLSKSLKYLKRCNQALAKAVADAEREQS